MNMQFPKLTTLSSSVFSDRAKNAIDNQPVRKTVHVAEIDIYDTEHILYKGQQIKISKKAFAEFMKLLHIPQQFIQRFYDVLQHKPESRQSFINALKSIMTSTGKGSSRVTLLLSRKDREIIGIKRNARNIISARGYLDTVTRVIDENNLDIVDFAVSSTGETAINTIQTGKQWNVSGMKDEYFHGGVSFVNSPNSGFIVSPYVNRLVCANGMVTRGFEEQFKLTTTDGLGMQKFFADLGTLAKKGFKPDKFVEHVKESQDLAASLDEMKQVKAAIKSAAPDITPEELEAWVPLKKTEAAFHRIGVDTQTLRKGQLKNAKTGTSVWDLINGLTHWATHDNGFELSDYERARLQMRAGQLLCSEKDMSNFIRSPY